MKEFCAMDGMAPQWIIVGLGNPGAEHQYNRHNAGFLCLDVLADAQHIKVDKLKYHAFIGFGELGGQRCMFMKPNTYMNESGRAVSECMRFYQLPPERVLVIFDDISFPPGTVRIRRHGSSGGHKGIKSITQYLGSQAFPRIKLGVGQKPYPDYDLADWVVTNMSDSELNALREACDIACKAAELIVSGEIDDAMSMYSH